MLVMPFSQMNDGDRDGIPNVVLEAMSAGLPIIAGDAGSVSEVISEKTGYLLKNTDPETISNVVLSALSDIQKTIDKTKQAQLMIKEKFNRKLLVKERVKLLSNVKSGDRYVK